MKYVLSAFVMAVTPVFASNDVFTGTRIPPLPGECAQSDNTSYFDGALWMSSVDGHWEIYANQYTCSGTNFMWLLLPIDTTGRSPNSLSKSEFWRQRSFAGSNR